MTDSADASAVKRYLTELQDRITAAVENIDAAKFRRDAWNRPEGGGGESRVLSEGAVFERAGVSVSHVFGEKMPPSASNLRPEIAGAPFEAMGLSLVFHPRNPHAPTTHCNVRFLVARPTLSSRWGQTFTRSIKLGATAIFFCRIETKPAESADCSSTI